MDQGDKRLLLEVHGTVHQMKGRLDEALPELRRDVDKATDLAQSAHRKATAAEAGNKRTSATIGTAVAAAFTGLAEAVRRAF